jgi:lysophospholipase L1-like esterase
MKTWTILSGVSLFFAACGLLSPATARTPAALPAANAPPCDPPLETPPSLLAAVRAQFDEANAGKAPAAPAAPPAADLAAYQKMQAEQQKRDWSNLCKFRADNLALSRKPADPQRVVFMGDSITQNWLLAHGDFFATHFVNRGISGQTTPQMLVRFRADVIALHPAAVHILAGVNDIAGNTGPSTLSAIEDNIMAMVEIARANKVRVILASPLPTDTFNWAPKIKPADDIRAYNAWLKDYAARNKLTYVDYYTPMATASGGLKPDLALDGVHPNKKGYDVMEPLARAAIAAATRR